VVIVIRTMVLVLIWVRMSPVPVFRLCSATCALKVAIVSVVFT
jgi:hypothetical protein